MNLYVQYNLKNNINNLRFLRENSYWYKYLNRSSNYLPLLEKEMKIRYKLTPKDKLDRFTKNIDKVSELIDIFS